MDKVFEDSPINQIITRSSDDLRDNILIGFEKEQLTIYCMDDKAEDRLNDKENIIIEPNNGFWTHDALEAIDYNELCPKGWDAYLGEQWIGSSEI